jgi:hypothetical protein
MSGTWGRGTRASFPVATPLPLCRFLRIDLHPSETHGALAVDRELERARITLRGVHFVQDEMAKGEFEARWAQTIVLLYDRWFLSVVVVEEAKERLSAH